MKRLILFSLIIVAIMSCNKDDCPIIEPAVIEVAPKFCEVENPLTDLTWLSEAYDSIQNLDNFQGYIFSYELRSGEELIGLTGFRSGIFYTCSGKYFCSYYGGWSNDCYPRLSTATIREQTLLYSK